MLYQVFYLFVFSSVGFFLHFLSPANAVDRSQKDSVKNLGVEAMAYLSEETRTVCKPSSNTAAIELDILKNGEHESNATSSNHNFSAPNSDQTRYEVIIVDLKKLLEKQKLGGKDLAQIHHKIGFAYYCNKQYVESIEAYKIALAIKEWGGMNRVLTHHYLGRAYHNNRQFREAGEEFKKSLEKQKIEKLKKLQKIIERLGEKRSTGIC